ncbi:membrane protein [Spirochaetia bacterium]|nr:membrane protein [Spirochaetia bacterium]
MKHGRKQKNLGTFRFISAEGFFHTRSRTRYLLRLLIGFELMNIVSTLLTIALPNENVMLIFSMFGSLFFTVLYLILVDMLLGGIREKRPGKVMLALLLMALPLVYGFVTVLGLQSETNTLPPWAILVLFKFIPNLLAVEGSFLWPLLGVLFCILRKNRFLRIIPLVVFGILFSVLGSIEGLVIFAAIPVLLYNGQRGRGSKYFFYIFYPAHIYLFYVVAWFMR